LTDLANSTAPGVPFVVRDEVAMDETALGQTAGPNGYSTTARFSLSGSVRD